MAVNFTEEQRKVIDVRGKNILVSAAAGSGKTAVLVERIVQKVCDEKNPVDIDRLLIVTFTSAAAAQMRERISKAIQKKLDEQPENEALYEHLQKQSALIHNAQITTIDSFCLFIIRNNFNQIGLDPGFRVADEGEVKLIEKDTLDKLLEDKYAQQDARFLRFCESYSTGASEKPIEDSILKLYHFSMSTPFPEQWLMERMNDYKVVDANDLVNQKWFKKALTYMSTILAECESRIMEARHLASSVGGPIHYLETLDSDLEIITRLRGCRTYQELSDGFTYIEFKRLSTKKPEGVDPDIREAAKAIRDDVKKSIEKLQKFLFQISPNDTISDMRVCDEMVHELVELTLEFKKRLDQAKRDSNVLDFSDMEHFALEILLKKEENGDSVSKDLMEHFEEIMIDEYQDSNEVQELILSSISGQEMGRFNRFMVGDVKQSIYKFRLARPEIFMEKYDTYPTDDSSDENVRIDLSKNFRSRSQVTDSANFICGQLMKKEVGNVEYTENVALHAAASYPSVEEAGECYDTELLLACNSLEEDSEDELDAKQKEATMVADKINQLVGNFTVTDSDTGQLRKARYSDIVILFRATAGWDEDFRRILTEKGIPVHITSKTGYFSTMEIQNIVNLLRILDNPLQDIPFFGVMKIPYFGFTDEEIARIRCIDKAFLYEQVCQCSENDEKSSRLIDFIKRYRKKVAYTSIKQLIQEILEETGYALYVAAMPAGEQRLANIELLLEKAGAFEKTSFYGLFHFIRYLETIQEQEVDFGEANILDENANVVRIMTIHKSKGLEFPICFVCGLSKQFNEMDIRQGILMDVELGIGVDYIDPINRLKRKTLRKNVISQCMKEDSRGEDLRVLYVALTRAKEKLILTGHVKDLTKLLQNNSEIINNQEEKVSYSVLMDAKSYMDLVIPALMRHKAMEEIIAECGLESFNHNLPYSDVPFKVVLWYENQQAKLVNEVKEVGRAAQLEADLDRSALLMDVTLREKLQEKLNFRYPHTYLEGLTVKTTVSELKKGKYEAEVEAEKQLIDIKERDLYSPDKEESSEEETTDTQPDKTAVLTKEPYIPRFMSDSNQMLGTQYGTAVHKVCELLSFDKARYGEMNSKDMLLANIQVERKKWIEQGTVTNEDISCVRNDKIVRFLQSGIARRMMEARENDNLYKEQPFVIGIPARRVDEKFPEEETLLIQGVIDAFFIEEDGIVLLDYKTDNLTNANAFINRYKTQLDYYEEALNQLTGDKKVKEKYIYSFKLDEVIKLDLAK